MKIELNGEVKDIQATTLGLVMIELGFANKAVATAVNGTFIPVAERETCMLTEGARVEIVAPIQGG